MKEQETIEAIHGAICEDSLRDCYEDYGLCVRAGDAVRELIGGYSA